MNPKNTPFSSGWSDSKKLVHVLRDANRRLSLSPSLIQLARVNSLETAAGRSEFSAFCSGGLPLRHFVRPTTCAVSGYSTGFPVRLSTGI